MPADRASNDRNPSGALDTYRKKRSAEVTNEPFGSRNPALAGAFVVQKHAARRTHYDLRLEMGGVLKSWAVPKGPSADPSEKRLAVETEDHPIDYQDFEGVIPAGQYGGGAMIVWDRGRWTPIEGDDVGYEKDKLLFELTGHKLRGVWTMFRIGKGHGGKGHGGKGHGGKGHGDKGKKSNEWLLMKKPDGWARGPEEAVYDERSVLSGLTVEELADLDGRRSGILEKLEESGAPAGEIDPEEQSPMLATVEERPFTRPGWVFELKYDGFRLLASKEGRRVRLFYRRGSDATHLFPDVKKALSTLPVERLLLDGEVVVLDDAGRPSFQRLQQRTQLHRPIDIDQATLRLPATYFAFDLLELEGHDLRSLELLERKELLADLLPASGVLRYCDHVPERGEDFHAAVQRMGLEGMVAKLADSPYRAGRSRDWLKIRADRRADFVIVGYTRPKGARAGFGALHLATYRAAADTDSGQELTYAGRVGTGFDDTTLEALAEGLAKIERETPPCSGPLPSGKGHHWVEPRLVCEVRYKQWTDEALLRQPAFLGLRPDKAPEECTDAPDEAELEPAAPPVEEKVLHLTNLDKVFWPDEGYTKGDLIDYYRTIAPWILPYLQDRPLVLTRYPDGIDGKNFYQKHAPEFAPDWIRTETIWSEGSEREIDYFVCEDTDSLVYIANLGAIPLHIWSSRLSSLQQPDWCILDLDPKEAPFADVVKVARAIYRLCDGIGLETYVKTSGSSGIHVLIPLGGQLSYEQSRQLGELIANVVAREERDIATVARALGKRDGKVYIDWVQNGHGRLLVSPFCVRPKPKAPVSTPLRWSEVNKSLTIEKHTIVTVPKRMKRLKEDPMVAVLEAKPDLLAAMRALHERMEGVEEG